MEQIRSFIAIELPAELKAQLFELQARLKPGGQPFVKWVDPYGIHLTLKFLGNIAVSRIEEITKATEEAVQETLPFHLDVEGLGVFPNMRRVQVVWVGVGGEVDRLAQIQRRIDSNLAPLGFAVEGRPFTPHLTLARLRDQASLTERQKFGQLITSTGFEAGYSFTVQALSLMRSQLTREGAIYSRVGSIELKKSLSTGTA